MATDTITPCQNQDSVSDEGSAINGVRLEMSNAEQLAAGQLNLNPDIRYTPEPGDDETIVTARYSQVETTEPEFQRENAFEGFVNVTREDRRDLENEVLREARDLNPIGVLREVFGDPRRLVGAAAYTGLEDAMPGGDSEPSRPSQRGWDR